VPCTYASIGQLLAHSCLAPDSIRQFPDTRFAQSAPCRPGAVTPDSPPIRHARHHSLCWLLPAVPLPGRACVLRARIEPRPSLTRSAYPPSRSNLDDDPVAPWAPQSYGRNGWFTVVIARGGDHMGWFQSGEVADRWGDPYWSGSGPQQRA